ncbi:anthranilate synthase family protein [Plantactinospora sp. ZYX-F-223]|uniref:anthranilate synthase family protein n=1 Tax=Plantactinospora sp. ZYX-F-223 TaxID=3144103 RepID=UPI0031FBAA5A
MTFSSAPAAAGPPRGAADPGPSVLDRVLADRPGPFALLHRPELTGPGRVEVLLGRVHTLERLADVPLPDPVPGGSGPGTLVLVPYRQIAERGHATPDDGTPLLAMTVDQHAVVPVAEVRQRIPDAPVTLSGGHFDLDDDGYAELVRTVLADEIATGQGANFVLKRSFLADITDYTPGTALTVFRRLLADESGAYWTFVVHTGDRTLVGASPERHVSVVDGTATMNPISGTYRYPASGPTLSGVLDFLAEAKETDELHMVVDEELKMMARICDDGVRVVGPYLKEMARLAHTEYLIEGRTRRDVLDVLRETMFAPTVTGSPVESASRVISKYEPAGRGYYSGVVALIGRDGTGTRTLDSAILIRTAEIDRTGRLRITVGSTLVRHSEPAAEAAETRAKAAGLLAAFQARPAPRFGTHPAVRHALTRRTERVAGFWRSCSAGRGGGLAGRRVLVVDAEDNFTFMLGHQLRALGLRVTIRRFDEPYSIDDHDLVVLGPGPGDPRAVGHPKIAHLRRTARRLLDEARPFLAVCLSHQVLSDLLGFRLARLDAPNQGVQKEIELSGRPVRVGFYNSFAAQSEADQVRCADPAGLVEVDRDRTTGEVYALRGARFRSIQFHAESILTEGGVDILHELVGSVLRTRLAEPVAARS